MLQSHLSLVCGARYAEIRFWVLSKDNYHVLELLGSHAQTNTTIACWSKPERFRLELANKDTAGFFQEMSMNSAVWDHIMQHSLEETVRNNLEVVVMSRDLEVSRMENQISLRPWKAPDTQIHVCLQSSPASRANLIQPLHPSTMQRNTHNMLGITIPSQLPALLRSQDMQVRQMWLGPNPGRSYCNNRVVLDFSGRQPQFPKHAFVETSTCSFLNVRVEYLKIVLGCSSWSCD